MGKTKPFKLVRPTEAAVKPELKATVQVRETPTDSWKETPTVTAVSRNGAGFILSRKCEVGRLIAVALPLSAELRAYDENTEMYYVMAIVQYCNEGVADGKTVYHVGVGFIGKQMPASFRADPTQNYRIMAMKKDGLWEVTEAKAQFKNRKNPRYGVALPVVLSLIQKEKRLVTKEETFTKNLALGGVAVTSSLDARIGDKIKFACSAVDFYAIAEVRARMGRTSESTTLHLKFIDAQFPLEKLFQMQKSIAA
ncbi:MAG: hypothetical protein ABJB40_10835 [Acidobacteriota bacterium]